MPTPADGSEATTPARTAGAESTPAPAPAPTPTFAEYPPRRINLTGPAGSGKSTLAQRLAALLSLPHLELDSLFHGPGWVPRPGFAGDVEAWLRGHGEGWVVDGNYRKVRGLVWAPPAPDADDALPGADTVVILDLPKYTVLTSLFGRTMRRVLYGETLWNGNTETWANVLSTDPAQSVLAYCYTQFEEHRQRLVDAEREGRARGGVRFVRLRSREEVEGFVAELEAAAGVANTGAGAGTTGDGPS
ncbi:uncharacterized protein LOC62_03G004841 [Vanrija pseudolonga]|uniref:Adenylate kinase n=1 Tax=Vanrija pseudolonga TaxID=143232 RepID=A0AAF1BQS5_9TREE|nr:hypothetical protein LOC62_03G004841 [Vanrija pseudolonga]